MYPVKSKIKEAKKRVMNHAVYNRYGIFRIDNDLLIRIRQAKGLFVRDSGRNNKECVV